LLKPTGFLLITGTVLEGKTKKRLIKLRNVTTSNEFGNLLIMEGK
jgi:hypothetical protein